MLYLDLYRDLMLIELKLSVEFLIAKKTPVIFCPRNFISFESENDFPCIKNHLYFLTADSRPVS